MTFLWSWKRWMSASVLMAALTSLGVPFFGLSRMAYIEYWLGNDPFWEGCYMALTIWFLAVGLVVMVTFAATASVFAVRAHRALERQNS